MFFITCHDLGRHLSCYGVNTVQTPEIDGLAARGVRFSCAFSTSAGCSPARAAMATGRYPHSNGVMGLTHPPFLWDLFPGERHIASILADAGFETHLFGFQHVTTDIHRLGFQHLHGYDELRACHEPAWGKNVAVHVAEFLNGPRSERPLYLEINLEEPHRPFDQGGAEPDTERGVFVPPFLPDAPESREEMAAFQGAIRNADRGVGRILQALEDAGLSDDTLVVFVADHGIAFPRAKCTMYDPGIEVALVVHWPRSLWTGGQIVDDMVSTIDVFPTLLEIAGVPLSEGVQGRSFIPLLRGEPYARRTEIYAEKTYHSYYDPMRAVRTERFKYIRNFETTFAVEVPGDVQNGSVFRRFVERYHGGEHPDIEFYDLQTDPEEQRNLAGTEELAGEERRLQGMLWDWMEETNDPLLGGPIASQSYRRAFPGFNP